MNEIKKSDIQKRPRKKVPRKLLIGAGVVIALVFIGGGAYAYLSYRHQQATQPYTVVCSSTEGAKVLANTNELLTGSKQAELKQKIEQIQTLPQYSQDPNCLATMTVYYLYDGDLTKAQEVLNQLKAANKNNTSLDAVFLDSGLSAGQLEAKLKYFQELNENAKRNTIYMGEDGADAVQQ